MSEVSSSNHSQYEDNASHCSFSASASETSSLNISPDIFLNHHLENILSNGEENEEIIFKIRSKLYRWRQNEWKERGIGEIKFLKHKFNNKIRIVMRQDKTKKAVANFIISDDPLCMLKNHMGSNKMFFFSAIDFSEGSMQIENFVFKFANAEYAGDFQLHFEHAKMANHNLKEVELDINNINIFSNKKE
jgi:hypothetical protein